MANRIFNLSGLGFGKPGDLATPITPESPLPVAGLQEAFGLAGNNSAADPVVVYGGDYVLAQLATGYGSLKLQIMGPDNVTWLDLVTKTASDANGAGTGVALPSKAQVRVVLTGTTGAFATLKRVP